MKLNLTEKQALESLEKARESEEIFDDIYKINPSRALVDRTKIPEFTTENTKITEGSRVEIAD